jgi:hypothetical protein
MKIFSNRLLKSQGLTILLATISGMEASSSTKKPLFTAGYKPLSK